MASTVVAVAAVAAVGAAVAMAAAWAQSAYAVATGLLLLFAVTHTAGGLFGRADFGRPAGAVFTSMQTVTFSANGAPRASWYKFWLGFGLLVTVHLLFSAVVSWQLARLDRPARRQLLPLEWAFFAANLATTVLSGVYFFPPPAVTAALVTALVGFECLCDTYDYTPWA